MSDKVFGHSPGKNAFKMPTARTPPLEAKFEPEHIKFDRLVPPIKNETLGDLQLDVAEMKALLKKKSVETERQKREILDLRKETKRLRRENEMLQAQARMNSAATDALLEENESLWRKQIKIEQVCPLIRVLVTHFINRRKREHLAFTRYWDTMKSSR